MGSHTQHLQLYNGFKAGKLQANVDALSRLPLEDTASDVPIPGNSTTAANLGSK